jgi:hypothetical protein
MRPPNRTNRNKILWSPIGWLADRGLACTRSRFLAKNSRAK